MRSLAVTIFVAVLGVAGCASGPRATLGQLQQRAGVDLACPSHVMQLYHLDVRTKLVAGCGRQLVYIEDCLDHGGKRMCTWINNSPNSVVQQVVQAPAVATPTPRPPRQIRTRLFNEKEVDEVLERRR